jgi:hypothetical protein
MSAMEAVGGCSPYPRIGGFPSGPAHPDPAAARPRCLPMAGRFTGQAWWVPVVRHACFADDSRDSEQRFPVSVQLGKARQETAATIAACTICPLRAQAWRGCSGTGISAHTGSGAAWSPPKVRPCAVSCMRTACRAPASISRTARRSWCGGTGITRRPIAGQTERASDRQAGRREWRRTALPVRGYTGLSSPGRSVRPAGVMACLIADELAGVTAATGAGAGLAGASQIARRS